MGQINLLEKQTVPHQTFYPSPHGATTGLGDAVSEASRDNSKHYTHILYGKEGTNVIEHILSITHGS